MNNIERSDEWEILVPFFRYPNQGFYLRELSRELGWGPGRVKRKLGPYMKSNIIEKNKRKNKTVYRTRDCDAFMTIKRCYNILVLKDMAKDMMKNCDVEAIILLGKACNGNDTEDDTIRLGVMGKTCPYDTSRYGYVMNRNIELVLFREDKLDKEKILNPLLNGIVLEGRIKYEKKGGLKALFGR